MSEFKQFPKWKYKERKHVQGETAKIVNSAEEEKALGEGWFDSPADCPDREAEQAEIQRRYRERFEAAVGNPTEQVRIHIEYRSLHPDVADADSWHLGMMPMIPTLQTQAALDLAAERQVEDRERRVIEAEAIERPQVREETSTANRGNGATHLRSQKKHKPKHLLMPTKATPEERAQTVVQVIAELNTLKPQMYGEQFYEELRDGNGDFLSFQIAEERNDLKLKLVNIQGSTRHIRLAQELAAHYHGIVFETMRSDWKHHKPKNFPGEKYRKTSRKKRKNKA